jgi:alpha-N-arabinofuranosidase
MNRVVVKTQDADVRISRHIYGHFSEHLGRCIYGGYWVGNDPEAAASIPNTRGIRNDVVAALRHIKIPNLRWPGGCFADTYHWKDGIGPRQERPKMVNTHWGGVIEDNSFGTHEFLDLCEQLSAPGVSPRRRCEPCICGNVGSGTVQELSQWVEYCNFNGISPMADLRKKNGRADPWNVRFWGIGNENWGCGGDMTPEFYADNYRRYATYARSYDTRLYKIAGGASSDNYNWTRVLMEKAGRNMDALSLHYYSMPYGGNYKGMATDFTQAEWFSTMQRALRMEELVRKHGAIMDEFDPGRKVGMVVDEWGTWFEVEPGTNPGFLYQQNTMRDAVAAGIHLNIFNNNASRVSMANLAQTINVLQSVILTEGPKMVLTPTYHVFDLYKVHQDALLLPVSVESESVKGMPVISVSASMDDANKIHLSLTNSDPVNGQSVPIEFRGITVSPSVKVSGQILVSENMTDYNTFDKPGTVILQKYSGATLSGSTLMVELLPRSVVTVELAS